MAAALGTRVAELVRNILDAMGLPLEVAVDESADGIRVELLGEGRELLLRRKGEGLDALQHLINTVFRRDLRDVPPVVIDTGGFRRDKDAELQQMARFLMERARATGMPQEIGPLNPYARRIVHLTVAEDASMTSESVGDAFLKTVVISTRTPSGTR